MRKIKENFYLNALFSFESARCDCRVSTLPSKPGMADGEDLYVGAVEGSPIRFAYAPTDGLLRIKEDGSTVESNILGSFLAIKRGDAEGYARFFRDNGFLLPLGYGEFHRVCIEGIDEVSTRMLAVLELQKALGLERKQIDTFSRYEKMVLTILRLICADPVEVSVGSDVSYAPCNHPISSLLENPTGCVAPSTKDMHDGNIRVLESDGIKADVDTNFYQDVISGFSSDEWNGQLQKAVVELFVGGKAICPEDRNLIEMLYHYFTEVGPMAFQAGEVVYIQEPDPQRKKLSETLKAKIEKAARHVLKEEIDHNVARISPVYDSETLGPKWKVDSLLGALYFSIFYLRPGVEVMKQCANPSCGKYFVVSRTDSKKKYCCDQCRNRMSQKNHRKRHPKQ